MRKPRDFDAELKALSDKTQDLKQRRVLQLGELVIACKADVLTPEQLAGALLAAVEADTAARGAWRDRGAAFFQRGTDGARKHYRADKPGTASDDSGAPSA